MLTFPIDKWNYEIQPKMLKAGFPNPPGKDFVFVKGEYGNPDHCINIVFEKPSYETMFRLQFLE